MATWLVKDLASDRSVRLWQSDKNKIFNLDLSRLRFDYYYCLDFS